MNGEENDVAGMRRRLLEREAQEVKLRRIFGWGFAALYVFSATVSQITVAVLLNYLVAGAS